MNTHLSRDVARFTKVIFLFLFFYFLNILYILCLEKLNVKGQQNLHYIFFHINMAFFKQTNKKQQK